MLKSYLGKRAKESTILRKTKEFKDTRTIYRNGSIITRTFTKYNKELPISASIIVDKERLELFPLADRRFESVLAAFDVTIVENNKILLRDESNEAWIQFAHGQASSITWKCIID
jgi:hypothetical protein